MILLTAGFWIFVIPFYPARCIRCGLSREAVNASASPAAKAVAILFICFAALLVIAGLLGIERSKINKPEPESISSSPEQSNVVSQNPRPLSTTSLQQSDVESEKPSPKNIDDHELHLMPNLFGRGAVSDGRIYSVASIVPYMMSIPPATKIFFQGVVTADMGANAISIADEKDRNKVLVCMMTPETYQDLLYQLRQTHSMKVNGFGDFDHAWTLGPVFKNCEFSDATDSTKVVRPLNETLNAVDSNSAITDGDSATRPTEHSTENSSSTVAPIVRVPPDSFPKK